ncbi:MAG: 50S ribosomal protein L18 [Clostridiales bacterium]|nr:50S ribosomal protein L18 [Clostridiales bacterium]
MIKKSDKNKLRRKKHMRIRNKITGTPERPRLNVYKSSKNIYAQIIDDSKGVTLVSASTVDPAIKGSVKSGGNIEAAKEVGKLIAQRAVEKGLKLIVFDRGGYVYHGRVKELADAARAEGLEF